MSKPQSILHITNFIPEQSKNSGNYNNLLKYMFNSADGANVAGLNYIRVPIGASDFSAGGKSATSYYIQHH